MLKIISTITSSTEGYPFNIRNVRLPNFNYKIKIKLAIPNGSSNRYFKKINKITELELLCSSLIRLVEVIDDQTLDEFLLVYEYIPYSLEEFTQLKIQTDKVESKLCQLCEFLLHKRILPTYNAKNFGFNENKELKYLLLPSYSEISDQIELKRQFDQLGQNVKLMLKSIKTMISTCPKQTLEDDKTSQRKSDRDLSAYKRKFQQKISCIENKLLLISKQGYNDKHSSSQRIKRRKKLSQNFTEESFSVSSQSQNSFKLIDKSSKHIDSNEIKHNESGSSVKNEYQQSFSKTHNQQFYHKSQNEPSKQNSSQQEQQSPQSPGGEKCSKLTNSLIIQEKNEEMEKLKHHKSSFGDYSNHGNESQRQMKLKRRISFALEKSQYALKIYEKYQSMRSQHPSNTKRS